MDVVLVTGGFDPLHSGHIEYFKEARKLGNKLVVGLNSDAWLTRKKGRPFMQFKDRLAIIQELKIVDDVISFDDSDDSACGAIYKTLATHGKIKVIFANGGDRTNTTTPEYKTYNNLPYVDFVFGVGGEYKMNSSSWILDEWKTQKTNRDWGYWRVLDHKPEKGYKVKELVIEPGKCLSDQRHFFRSEHWHVVEGIVTIDLEYPDGTKKTDKVNIKESGDIPVLTWHRAYNNAKKSAKVIETWFGNKLTEDDIERRNSN